MFASLQFPLFSLQFTDNVCFVLFPIDVTAIKHIFVHLHAYLSAKYILQLNNIIIANVYFLNTIRI